MFEGILTDWESLLKQGASLIKGEPDPIANLANSAALLNLYMKDINWVGFYLKKDNELVLGPFQGRPACIRIALGKGVCGTAAAEQRSQRVSDVHSFPGHIACDSASRSELVIPLMKDSRCLGVLDIDSPLEDRFTAEDQLWLERFASQLSERLPTTS